MLHGLSKALRAVAACFPAANRICSALNLHAAAAEETVIKAHLTLFERHGQRYYFERRAGLVCIRQGLIPPLQALCIGKDLILFLLRRRFFDRFFSLIADVEKIIKVISAYRRHCKYLPCFHIHRDSARSVLNVVILDGLIQRLFNIMLDREVNRCYKIKAIFGTGVALVLVKQKIGAVGIGKAHVFSRRSTQSGVILRFHPVKAVVIGSDKAYHMAGKRGIRIVSFRIALQPDALELILVFKFAHLVGSLFFDLARNGHIPRAVILGFFQDILLVEAEDLGKLIGNKLPVFVVHGDLRRAKVHIIDICAHCENVHVAVVYRSALGRCSRFAKLLAHGKLLIFGMIAHLQDIKPHCKHRKRKYAAHCHQK